MGIRVNAAFSTYFEVLIGNSWKRYRTEKVLAGRKDILAFCQALNLPVECEHQIVAYQIKETGQLRELAAVEL